MQLGINKHLGMAAIPWFNIFTWLLFDKCVIKCTKIMHKSGNISKHRAINTYICAT